MKVLFCHNHYRYRGGEDQSFESEVAMLRDEGHQVITYIRNNADIDESLAGKIRTSARTLYSRGAKREIGSLIQQHEPDVLHCNNLFPQISTSIYRPARHAGVPIVQSLRNYRTFCANSFFYRDERVCTDCLSRSPSLAAIRHACYRDSRAASAVVATMQVWQRSMEWIHPSVALYFTPSEFARQTHISGGFDPERIVVKPNFIDPDPGIGISDSNTFVYVGRLSQEKGLLTVMKAWQELDVPLTIVGDGPMRQEVESFAELHPQVTYDGLRSLDEVIDLLGNARALVMPSLWYETFGRTIAESFSRGTPVIASRLGAMAELVEDGFSGYLFQPGSSAELASAVRRLASADAEAYGQMRVAARTSFTEKYSRSTNYQRLMEIYRLAISMTRSRRTREQTTVSSVEESTGQ